MKTLGAARTVASLATITRVTSAAIEADENKKHMGAIEYLGLQRPTQ